MTKWFLLLPVLGSLLASTVRWNILAKYTNSEFESKNRATAISALNMIIGVIFVLVMGSSGYVMDTVGGVRGIYTILGLSTLFFALPLGLNLAKNHSS